MNTLDVRSLLQDDAIEHVEMVEAEDETCEKASNVSQNDEEDEVRSERGSLENEKFLLNNTKVCLMCKDENNSVCFQCYNMNNNVDIRKYKYCTS